MLTDFDDDKQQQRKERDDDDVDDERAGMLYVTEIKKSETFFFWQNIIAYTTELSDNKLIFLVSLPIRRYSNWDERQWIIYKQIFIHFTRVFRLFIPNR